MTKSHLWRNARLAAIQALYASRYSGKTPADSVRELDGKAQVSEDEQTTTNTGLLTALIERLADPRHAELLLDRTRERTIREPLLLDIVSTGLAELIACPDQPVEVILGDYTEIAASYFDPAAARLVNGILGTAASEIRPH